MIDKKCSFCGASSKDVLLLIEGPLGTDVFICGGCTVSANEIVIQDDLKRSSLTQKKETKKKILKPKEIKNFLDQYVIGQDDAKKSLSVAVYNHYKRILSNDSGDGVDLEKSNVLFIGETGTGKTLLAKTISKILDVPFCIADATSLTEAGYVGDDVESIISRLLQVSNYNIPLTEMGIIFIDEIDKISRKNGDSPSITRDVSGEGVQQALLKMLEGTIVNVSPEGGRKHPEQKMVQINTKNILFILGGAFDGIERIISSRLNTNKIGFKNNEFKIVNKNDILQYVSSSDLKSYGLIPELIGRIPIVTHLNNLTKETLIRILTEPKNSIMKQYTKLFKIDDIDLKIDSDVLEYIVDCSIEYNLGARGLRSIFEKMMRDFMFELPSDKKVKKLHITIDIVKEKLKNNITFAA